MTTYIKAQQSNGGLSEDASSAASGLAQSANARYRALAGLSLSVIK